MKRSNRLIMLVGLLLAVVAFVAVFYLLQQDTDGGDGDAGRRETVTVFATQDIPLGTFITEEFATTAFEEKPFDDTQRATDAFASRTLIIGETARQDIAAGAQITASMFQAAGSAVNVVCPPIQRCISVQVDQVSGVGTLIKPGDWVDMVVGFTADKFPVVTLDPDTETITPVAGINATTVKVLLQGIQVMNTLLPPPQDTDGDGQPDQGTGLTGQQEIVILSVTAQQAEIVKFAQLDGSVSLVLRSSKDFQDPNDPTIPVTPLPDETTGIILKTLVDEYGVLVPQIIETILPEQAETP